MHGSWFVIPVALTCYIVFLRGDLASRYAVVWVGVFFAALPLFFLLPTEPPWMALSVERITRVAFGVPVRADNNPLAALPSLHVAVPAAQALWLRTERMNRAAAAFGLYTVAMAFSLVYLDEHYAVDCIAGALVAVAVLRASQATQRRFWRRTEPVLRP